MACNAMKIPLMHIRLASAALIFPMLFSACKPEPAAVAAVETGPEGMRAIPGGTFKMGSEGAFDTPFGPKSFPEEAPIQKQTVGAFWMDETEVTNRQFARFVAASGYITFAERPLDRESLPPEALDSLPSGDLTQGALVFVPPPEDAEAESYHDWWKWDPAANWRHPFGADSSIDGKDEHPVVCVTLEDAEAYAAWAGKRVPTEAEWEFAARGGFSEAMFTWGNHFKPGDQWMANTWQGEFPRENTADDGFVLTAPAKSFPANGYQLHDMAGNVWEICTRGQTSYHIQFPPSSTPTRGGSYLCHISYCMRYRPAARQAQEPDSPTSHTGFRCVRDIP